MPEHDTQRAAAREDLCRLLAACYYEPDADLAEMNVTGAILGAARQLDPVLAQSATQLGEAFSSAELEALTADFKQLFSPGTGLVPPQGSHWLGGPAQQQEESTAALLALYQEGGFEIEDDAMEPPDHVALQLEFLYRLTAKLNEGPVAGWDAEVLKAWRHLRQMFLRAHLGAWVHRFTLAVKTRAQTPFYRELAELTERFVRIELAA